MLPVAPALLLLAASTAATGPTGMLKTEDDDAMRRHLEESMPPVPSPRIKKVHIVSLTHLDVGGYCTGHQHPGIQGSVRMTASGQLRRLQHLF